MSAEIPLESLAKLKDILQRVSESRAELETGLAELRSQVDHLAGVAPQSGSVPDDTPTDVQALQERCKELETRLKSAQSETRKALSDQDRMRSRVAKAVQDGNQALYRAIGILDPVERVQKEADRLRNSNRRLENGIKELERDNTALRAGTDDLTKRVTELEGLASRYEREKGDYDQLLEDTQKQTHRELIQDLIGQVTPRRMAILLDGLDSDSWPLIKSQEKSLALERVLNLLAQIGLRIMHRQGDRVRVEEDELLDHYRLDEPYREGEKGLVVSPGFTLGDQVLVQTKVKYPDPEAVDGTQEHGDDTNEMHASSTEIEASRGGADKAHQTARSSAEPEDPPSSTEQKEQRPEKEKIEEEE